MIDEMTEDAIADLEEDWLEKHKEDKPAYCDPDDESCEGCQ